MEHDVRYVGSAVHPHIRDRMVYLYRCRNCNAPFARPMQGAFMAGQCDYIQAAKAADNATLAARLRGLAKGLAFWPKAARLVAEAATRLEAIQVKVEPEGDKAGFYSPKGRFTAGSDSEFMWARKNGKTTFQEEAMRHHQEAMRRSGEFSHAEAFKRAQEAAARHGYGYGSTPFEEAGRFRRHTEAELDKIDEMMKRAKEAMKKAHKPLTAEELDELHGEPKRRKTKPEQPYYRQNQRY